MPLGVTGNTSASGAEESWFDPRRGNWKPDTRLCAVGLFASGTHLGAPITLGFAARETGLGLSDIERACAVDTGATDRWADTDTYACTYETTRSRLERSTYGVPTCGHATEHFALRRLRAGR